VTPRRDPYYRPGGTTDYAPQGGVTPSASPDRYSTPAPGGSDPYAQPAGNYQPAAAGYNGY
jgi:hypothetical protein